MKHSCPLVFFLAITLFFGCAAHTNLEPIGKGKVSTNLSLGGPIIKAFGTRIPVPYATVGANYGVSDRIDLNSNLHLLSLAYKVFGLDFGATWYPVLNNGKIPTIGIQPRLLTLMSLKSDVDDRMRVYPIISVSSAWNLNNSLVYLGSDLTIPVSSMNYDKDAEQIYFSPFAGYKFSIGQKTSLQIEIKWHGSNVRSDQLAVEYLPLSKHGAISTLFSIERSF